MEAKKNKKRQQFSDTIFVYSERAKEMKKRAGITEKYLKECEEHHKRVGSPFAHVNVFGNTRHKKSTN